MANVKVYSVKKDGNLKLSPNFIVREFRCIDGTDEVLIDLELVKLLQSIVHIEQFLIMQVWEVAPDRIIYMGVLLTSLLPVKLLRKLQCAQKVRAF